MGMMKNFLIEKVAEYAKIRGWTEEEVYADSRKYKLAELYADTQLKNMLKKANRIKIEEREDYLAEQEYQMKFADLPSDIKLNIHDAVLEEFEI